MAFHEVRFPDDISRGARGGPERRTQVVELASGDEERNASWADSRRRYDAAYGIRRADDLAAVLAFFEARNGGEASSGWSVDATAGVVTFATAPASGVLVTAGFEFDVPVRFDTDRLDVTWDLDRLGSIASIPLVEVRR